MIYILLAVTLLSAVAPVCAANLPNTRIPDFSGSHYETLSPDTIDLANSMELSINGMVRSFSGPPENPFPPLRFVSNTRIDINAFPHQVLGSRELHGQTMLGVLLARMATGNTQGLWVDTDWRTAWLEWQKAGTLLAGPEGGRQLEWMAFNMSRENEPDKSRWNALINEAVADLADAAIDYKEGSFIGLSSTIPVDGYEGLSAAILAKPDLKARKAAIEADIENKRPTGFDATYDAWTVEGLCAVYRETGNKDALKLAGRLVRYLKDYAEVIGADGKFLAVVPGSSDALSFHHSFQVALACAEYAATSHNSAGFDFVKTAYEHALSISSTETGYTPVFSYGSRPTGEIDDNNIELCSGSDLAQMAYWLTIGGVGDYWEDVERFVRNQISAAQLADTRWAYDLPVNKGSVVYPNSRVETAVASVIGLFGQFAAPNDLYNQDKALVCCTGNTVRTLYYIWKNSIGFIPGLEGGALHVNILMNRATQWADVNSYIPYRGKVEIRVKADCSRVFVRAPEWVPTRSRNITCKINKKLVPLKWQGRYIDIGEVKKGQIVDIMFPIVIRNIDTQINGKLYTLTVKGNTVLSIDPPGKVIPIYERDKYLSDQTVLMRTGRYLMKTPALNPNLKLELYEK